MTGFNLDPNINNLVCASNTNKQSLTISTDNYANYNFITLHNYYRVFALIGLITIAILVPLSKFIGKVSNRGARIGLVLFVL